MSNRTDPRIEKKVCDLRRQGFTKSQIVERTGVKESTVKAILRRNGLTKNPDSSPSEESRTPARDQEDATPQPDPQRDPSTQPPRREIDPNLTQENASHEIIAYTQFFRSRTKKNPYAAQLSAHDLVWSEGNYGKRWFDGVKLMVDTTGLSPESLLSIVDDFEIDITDALKRFNEKYRP